MECWSLLLYFRKFKTQNNLKKTILIGKKIELKSPLYMLDGELSKISNDNFDITFSDSDIDLNL